MEKSITVAGRVRRRLKAGRPARIRNEKQTALQVLNKLANEAEKGRSLMAEEGLNPDDIKLALLYFLPRTPDPKGSIGVKWFTATDKMGGLLEELIELDAAGVHHLGILWKQADHEANIKTWVWVTQFLAGPLAEKLILLARNVVISGEAYAH